MYTYDFGDSWEHGIVVEKMLPAEAGRDYPTCIDGKRQGPPEDCGGLHGFYNLLEAIRDPEHDEHEDLLDWVGDDFDPATFSIDEVNRRLAPLQQRRSKTAAAKKLRQSQVSGFELSRGNCEISKSSKQFTRPQSSLLESPCTNTIFSNCEDTIRARMTLSWCIWRRSIPAQGETNRLNPLVTLLGKNQAKL